MRDLELVNGDSEGTSQKKLDAFYEKEWIPKEKKAYLTNLAKGSGPFLPTEKNEFILDASSQIATLGFGFNASPLLGVSHHIESWWNRKDTGSMVALRRSFRDFLLRKAGWCLGETFFCNSGAEAVEVALGNAFRRRRSESQVKVLAFRGSFHGRFLLSLSSTWNPVKREESEWPDFKSVFCDLPEMKSDHSKEPKIPKGWRAAWGESGRKDFPSYIKKQIKGTKQDKLLASEIEALLKIREELASGIIFAVLAEPLQCEGGDRYSSARYHNGLINLCQSYGVPLIYDEVQTGFGLGGPFFWHRLFNLKDEAGAPLFPDYIVAAKKAQLGVVLSHEKIDFREQFATHSMVRGYLQGMALDQSREETAAIESEVRKRNTAFVKKFKKHLECPRTQGLAFSFDFKDKGLLEKFIQARFAQGLMYYPAGSNTARFRLNLAYKPQAIALLFQGLSNAMAACVDVKQVPLTKNFAFKTQSEALLNRHRDWQNLQWSTLGKVGKVKSGNGKVELKDTQKFLKSFLGDKSKDISIQLVSSSNFTKHSKCVQKLQRLTYEPTRRTGNDEYLSALKSKMGVGVAIFKGKEMIAFGIAGSLEAFPKTRGVKQDFRFGSETAAYVCDITVSKKLQGYGFGTFLKHALARILQKRGAIAMQGRNRDQHAAKMIKLNLSMGAIEQQHLREDYPDVDVNRDAIYYTIPLRWQNPPLRMSLGVESPWSGLSFSKEFRTMAEQYLHNKMCLSNFVSADFLDGIEKFAQVVPKPLQHFYTTSGQSECVDKIVKSIWANRKVQRLLTFNGGFFGHGSMLSRGLSGVRPTFFPTDFLDRPTEKNWQAVLNSVRDALKSQSYLAVFVEPMGQQTMEKIPLEFLKLLSKLCRENNTPLVSNDTGGQFGRYSADAFLPSSLFQPDGAFVFTGGHMGICCLSTEYYVDKPLYMISTWDGDEYSLQAYVEAIRQHLAREGKALKLEEKFQRILESILDKYAGTKFHGDRGYGWIEGTIPLRLATLFSPRMDGRGLLVCPNHVDMNSFINEKSIHS